MTVTLLQETEMGKVMTQLKKAVKDHAAALALVTEILADWKEVAAKESAARKRKREESAADETAAPSTEKKAKAAEAETTSSSAPGTTKATSTAAGLANVKPTLSVPPVPIRKDLINRLVASLTEISATAAANVSKALQDTAVLIEGTVYESFKSTSDDYKTKLREINYNLKKNDGLRERVATGEISPEKFATMSSEEMVSDEAKAEAARIAQEVDEARKPPVLEPNCSTARCSKCHGNRIHVREAQTRSSDEPMTQFFTCLDCKLKWKR